MQPGFPSERLDRLEERVSALETLPAKVDALGQQILLLRTEMRAEFSAMRAELRAEFSSDLRGLGARIDDLGVQMRVLHEDVINRIALLGEAMNGANRKGRRGK